MGDHVQLIRPDAQGRLASSNIIAMSALEQQVSSGGGGIYTIDEYERLLHTAYTAFSAARAASNNDGNKCMINTGNWGCGAFGGHRAVACLVQVLAASLAGIESFHYYAFDQASLEEAQRGHTFVRMSCEDGGSINVRALLLQAVRCGFRWGTGDGN